MELTQVMAQLGPLTVASHATAAALWGIELVEARSPAVTVPRTRTRAAVPGWCVRRCDLAPHDVGVVRGVRCTTPLRTLVDLARQLPEAQAVAACDSALRQRLVLRHALVRRFAVALGPGAARLRAAAPLVDPRAESVLESLLRVLLVRAGLPRPLTQHCLRDRWGDVVARVDFVWPAALLVVEADGYAFHSDRAAYRRDRRRLNALMVLGWRVLRFAWEDVVGRPDEVVDQVRTALLRAA